MKPECNGPRPGSLRSFVPRMLCTLSAVALIFSALFAIATPSGAAPANGAARSAHVYLFRGLMNVFSLGMDEIATELGKLGIPASVYNHLSWSSVADSAAADYKSGKVKTIILVGHSAGATAVTSAAERIGQLGVPVKLAIGLDPLSRVTASGRVGRYLNFYVGNGAGQQVAKGSKFNGSLQNVNVQGMSDVGHFNIDKNRALQARVIREIRSSL